MNCIYSRDEHKSYMILEGMPRPKSYETGMISRNEIPGLLKFRILEHNDSQQVWYDITARKSLRDYLEQDEPLDVPLLAALIGSLAKTVEEIGRYLIPEQHLYLAAESIYLDPRQPEESLMLCYCPLVMEEQEGKLLGVMEYLISVVDHSREDVRSLTYDLYAAVAERNCTYSQLVDMLPKEQPVAQIIPEPGTHGEESAPGFGENRSLRHPGAEGCRDLAGGRLGSDRRSLVFDESLSRPQTGESVENPPAALDPAQLIPKPAVFGWFARIREKLKPVGRQRGNAENQPTGHESRRKLTKPGRIGLCRTRVPEKPPVQVIFDEEPEESYGTTLLSPSGNHMTGELLPEEEGVLAYEGSGSFGDIRLAGSRVNIGSAADNDVVLASPVISRHHAVIRRQADGWYLEDLHSLNGTAVTDSDGSGKWLANHESYRLKVGDRVRLAGELFVFR